LIVDASDPLTEISREASRIEEAAKYAGQTQFSSSKFWRGANLVLGVPAAALAAIAGATGLSETVDARAVALIALIAAALTATMTTLNAAQRSEQSRAAANAYLSLQSDARVFREIDLLGMQRDEARQRLNELIERRSTINDTAPVPAFIAYKLGSRNVAKGRQDYEVDRSPPRESR
jgi:hypothetical protein